MDKLPIGQRRLLVACACVFARGHKFKGDEPERALWTAVTDAFPAQAKATAFGPPSNVDKLRKRNAIRGPRTGPLSLETPTAEDIAAALDGRELAELDGVEVEAIAVKLAHHPDQRAGIHVADVTASELLDGLSPVEREEVFRSHVAVAEIESIATLRGVMADDAVNEFAKVSSAQTLLGVGAKLRQVDAAGKQIINNLDDYSEDEIAASLEHVRRLRRLRSPIEAEYMEEHP